LLKSATRQRERRKGRMRGREKEVRRKGAGERVRVTSFGK